VELPATAGFSFTARSNEGLLRVMMPMMVVVVVVVVVDHWWWWYRGGGGMNVS
jgi:hypothetical protein